MLVSLLTFLKPNNKPECKLGILLKYRTPQQNKTKKTKKERKKAFIFTRDNTGVITSKISNGKLLEKLEKRTCVSRVGLS